MCDVFSEKKKKKKKKKKRLEGLAKGICLWKVFDVFRRCLMSLAECVFCVARKVFGGSCERRLIRLMKGV